MAYEENRLAELAKRKVARLYKDIDMSFKRNVVTNDIGKKLDVNAVKQSLKNLLFTQFYEKPFNPEYGSPIAELLFEPLDYDTGNDIANLVLEAIKNFEPRVRVDDIIVQPDYDENEYILQINFHVIGLRNPEVFTTSLRRLK